MTRIAQVPLDQLSDEMRAHAENATPLERMLLLPGANAPELTQALHAFNAAMWQHSKLPRRLLELVRLRVAFHNQCRSCMAMRYQSALEDGLTEGEVCSLEKPYEAANLTEAEKAAIAYADISSTNHFAINDDTFDELRKYYSEAEIVELGMFIAYFIGFGRLAAAWDMVEELPEGFQDKSKKTAPWEQADSVVMRG